MNRAAPLPLDERRATLIAATEPLLEQYGREISTRQIAEAAGVAEGTIFRAFGTKDALVDAVLEEVFRHQPVVDRLEAIDPTLPLRDRLLAAVTIIQAQQRRVFALFHSLRLRPPSGSDGEAARERHRVGNEQITSAVADLLVADREQLRVLPIDAAQALRSVTFSLTHPMLGDPRLADPDWIVDLLVHGVCASTVDSRSAC